ncbi:tetratricopeptide repeat protein [Prochlorococcus marinus]|uniref:tetratricopeptide repeat protein n=1 Tax=Prochlorococcus marinus TaxID=1219 RepID=UPI0022B3BCF2|nr:tetratricopeptide repeat protein [Prochlorococcus marinus]
MGDDPICQNEPGYIKVSGVKVFSVPFSFVEIKENITIITNLTKQFSEEQISNQAFKFHSQGNVPEAAKYYQYFINQGFKDSTVFSNYGTILNEQGKLKEAEIITRKAIELNPVLAEAHNNLGSILNEQGKLKEAERSTRRAIELKRDYAKAYSNLGNILNEQGKLKEAERSTRRAIELNPVLAEAHNNLGSILNEQGKLKESEISTRKAIELKRDYAKAYSNLGNILNEQGKLKEAEISTRKAIELNPALAEAHSNLGNILNEQGKLKEAEIITRKAIELNPALAEAHNNLGNILSDQGKLKEAEISIRKAIDLRNDFEEAINNLGKVSADLGKSQEGEILLRKAINLKPNYAEACFNLSLIELLKGNYQSGLENYEFRFKTKKSIRPHCKPKINRKDNTEFQKGEKLLVVSEQGLGDTLQYMRYIPYLRRKGLEISFCAQQKLHSLIKSSAIDPNPLTTDQAITVSQGKWIPLLSLAKHLKIRPENPIINNPYIFSTDELVNKWKSNLSKEKRPIVGINWQGNPNVEKNSLKGRSLPLNTFSLLSKNNSVKFLSLQKGFGSEQLENCEFKNNFVESQEVINSIWDFMETAAIIENCDLIITSDTSVAHLAGGMGKKVWLLLRDIPFWTWGLEEETTFWYPSMRLFRQKKRHNWNEVMERVSDLIKVEMSTLK